jgi:ABC-type multidrug transport system ATPase subunit
MIQVRDLTVSFGERVALDRIGFDVARGEALALVGANGSGKTTVLRALLGLVPFAGRAHIGGHDVASSPVARSLVGYLPQRASFGDVTAAEAITFVAKLRRVERSRVNAVLDQVGLRSHAHERARTFSGGMQQRLSLAVALLAEPPVYLLDEPTASLDREGRAAFLDIATTLRRQGRTLLLASHRSDEIDRLCDRVLSLDEGRIVESDGLERSNVVALRPRAACR